MVMAKCRKDQFGKERLFAPKLGLDNFTAILDYNNLQANLVKILSNADYKEYIYFYAKNKFYYVVNLCEFKAFVERASKDGCGIILHGELCTMDYDRLFDSISEF